ncbi:hypothetical protein Q1695_010022 [Nippostrongylus brasiliensis]|nr:hypothetical protein Q1695_010022 [Nippostrongylus brasiliensis]
MDERGPAASTEENKSSGFFGGLRRGFLAKPSGSELPVDRTEDRASKGPRKGFLLSSKKEENGATEKKKDEGGGGRRMTEEASPPHKSSKIYNKCSADNPPFSSSGLEPTGIPVSSCGGCRGVVYVSSTYHYKVLCLENCTMDLHSECLTILLRRQDIGSIDELKIVTALKFKIHPALVYSFMDLDTVSGELSNGKPEPKKHSDEKNKARRTRDDVKTSPKKTSGVSTTSKTTSDPSDNLSGDGKEKKLCPNHPPEPLGPHGAVQVKESKPTMYAMEELLEPSLARSVENPSDAVFEGEKQDHLRVSDGAVQVKESEQTIYTVENSNELPNALPVESPSGVSSEGLRCLYSMDECRPAASPEDNKSSGFFGGLRRGFLAKRSESQVRVDSTEDRAPIGLRRGFLAKRSESVVRVDSTEDRASKGPRKGFLLSSKNEENGSTEKKKDESGGARHTTEGTSPHFSSVPSPPHESAKENSKCSADNPHFPPSGLESADIPAPACVDCLGVVNINSSYHYKAACWEECKMYLHSECLTKLLRRQNIDSVAELKKARVRKHKIALHCFNPCCSGLLLAIAEKYLNSVDGSAHSTIIYLLLDWDMEEAGQWSDEAEPEKHFDEKNLARRARDDVKASPKKTSGVSTTSKAASDPSDNLNGDGKEKKPCPTHPREPPGPNGAVQAVESKSTMYTVEKLLEPSPAASAENPSEAGLEGKKQGHLRAPDGAVQVKESEQTIYSVGNIPELPNALPVESPTVVSSEGIRCLYSMDERGPAASPEENKSSGFFGGLRRGFLAKRTGSEVPVDSKEDRTSKGLRSGATEKKKDEGGGDQHATEKTSPPHESSKVNNKCSADNPHFSPSGPGSEGIPVFTCGVCRGVVYINSSYHYKVLCVKNCTMYLHGECFTKWLSQHNIGSIDDLKIATALKFKIYSMPIYSLMDLDWVAGQMSKDLAEAKEHLDGKNITRRARDVKTSSKKTSEVPTASKIPIDPSNNLKGDGKEKKPCPTHAPGPPGPNGAVQAKETKRKKQGHPKTPDGIVQVKESEPTMYTVEKLPEQSPAAPVENPREAGLKGKGKKQGHLKAPDGAVQVKESEPTMYTVDNFPELPKALSVESPSIVYPEGEFPKEEQEHLYEADELRSVAPPAVPVLSLSPDLPTVEQPTQDDEEKVVEKYSVVSDPPKRNSKRARKKRNERECVQPDSIFKDDHEMVEAVVDGVKPFSRDLLLNTLHCAQPVERLRETIEMVMGRAYEPYRKPIDKIFNSEDLLRDFIGKLRIFIVSRERGRIIFSKGSLSGTYEKPFASSNRPVPRNPWKNVLDGAKTRSVTVEDRDCQVCLERFTSNGRVLSCPHKGCEEPYHEMCVRPWLMEQAKCPQCRRSWPDPVSFPQMGSF